MTCASSLCEIRGIYHQANRRQPRALAAATGILQQPTVWNGAAPGVGSLLDHGDFPRSGSLVDRRSMAAVRILGIRIGDSDDAVRCGVQVQTVATHAAVGQPWGQTHPFNDEVDYIRITAVSAAALYCRVSVLALPQHSNEEVLATGHALGADARV